MARNFGLMKESVTRRLRAEGHAYYSEDDIGSGINDGIDALAEATYWCERFGTVYFVAGQRLYDMRTALVRPAGSVADTEPGMGPSDHTRISLLNGSISVGEGLRLLSVGLSTVRADSPLGLPWSEFLALTHVYYPANRRWLLPATPRDLYRIGGQDWQSITGAPEYFYQMGQWYLGLFPKPNATSSNPGKGDLLNTVVAFFNALPARMTHDYETPIGLPDEFSVGAEEYCIYDLLCQEAETQKALAVYGGRYMPIETRLQSYTGRLRMAQERALGMRVTP